MKPEPEYDELFPQNANTKHKKSFICFHYSALIIIITIPRAIIDSNFCYNIAAKLAPVFKRII